MNTIEFAYRRFSRKRFPLPSEAQVRALEDRIKVDFADDYRNFLLEFNGGYFIEPEITPVGEGCPQDALTFLSGLGASHQEAELGEPGTLVLFDDNDPPKILPIGDTAMGGLIILDTAPGEGRGMIYLKKAFGDFYYLAEGIEEFFSLLHEPTPV
ncbi:MAG: SMI1/KNR4 family protein [Planctomycetia bacterium]|nr:SMI1/KNR4 family protein [Planctomycetia bacterium]